MTASRCPRTDFRRATASLRFPPGRCCDTSTVDSPAALPFSSDAKALLPRVAHVRRELAARRAIRMREVSALVTHWAGQSARLSATLKSSISMGAMQRLGSIGPSPRDQPMISAAFGLAASGRRLGRGRSGSASLAEWRFQPVSATNSASLSFGIIRPGVSLGLPLKLDGIGNGVHWLGLGQVGSFGHVLAEPSTGVLDPTALRWSSGKPWQEPAWCLPAACQGRCASQFPPKSFPRLIEDPTTPMRSVTASAPEPSW